MGAPTPAHLTPAHAAQWAKVSRRTIMRAIESGDLPAFRDNRNRWQITRQELENWMGAQCLPNGQRPPDVHSNAHLTHSIARLSGLDRDRLAADLETARLTIARLESRLEERAALVRAAEVRAQAAEMDRDHWRALAEKLTDRPTEYPADPPPAPPRRAWRWPWS